MSLKINRENLSVSEKIYDGSQEQSVELDYILPDYYHDIFKMIKCSICPSVTSYGINGETLSYELVADVNFLYCSQKDNSVHSISQRLTYSKSVNIGSVVSNPVVVISPKSEHINCRVVNKRRVDMRGAVSVKIRISGDSMHEAVCDVMGMNIQKKKIPVEYLAKKISKTKNITINEDVQLGASNPAVVNIVSSDIRLDNSENKVIANKLVVKGNADVKLLYTSSEGIESMSFTMPYSQIIDMEGLDESYTVSVKTECLTKDITAVSGTDGENKTIRAELKLCINCFAYKTITIELVSDLYSTAYPCEYAVKELAIEQAPYEISENFQNKILLKNDEAVSRVYDVRCDSKNINISVDKEKKTVRVSGMLMFSALAQNEDNMPFAIEKDSAFEHEITCDKITENSIADLYIDSIECSYSLSESDGISVRADVKICGKLCFAPVFKAVTDISVDDSVKITRDGDYALKLYYGIKGENVWNIAKKYCTSVNAITEENSIDGECLEQDGMLLIPIV